MLQQLDTIDYVQIMTTGDAIDFGDLTEQQDHQWVDLQWSRWTCNHQS